MSGSLPGMFPGKANQFSDALSRLKLDHFWYLSKQHNRTFNTDPYRDANRYMANAKNMAVLTLNILTLYFAAMMKDIIISYG